MVVATPLANPESHPWLAEYAPGALVWWLLRGGDGSAETTEVLATLLPSLGAGSRWVGRVEGGADSVQYVSGSAPSGRGWGGASRWVSAALEPMGVDEVTGVLDRADTVGVSVLVALPATPGDVQEHPASAVAGSSAPWQAVALRPATGATSDPDPWAVVGSLGSTLPATTGLSSTRARVPLPLPVASKRRPRRLDRTGLAALLVLTVLAAGLLVELARPRAATRLPAAGSGFTTPPLPAVPEPVYQPALALDAARGVAVLVGGRQPGTTTWLLAKGHWRTVASAAAPADRSGAAMAFDPVRRRLVLFGGRAADGRAGNDTWSWDGHSWSRLTMPGPRPPADEFAGMAWDATRRQMLLVTPAGGGPSGSTASTWTLGPTGWLLARSAANPPAEPSSALVFDPATHSVLLALSGLSRGATPSTWSWDGTAWTELHPAHEPDLGGFLSYLAPDPAHAGSVLLRPSVGSPQLLETWTWDGRDWTRRAPLNVPSFPAGVLAGTAAAEPRVVGREARTGGLTAAWNWNGIDWRRAPLRGPAR